MINFIKDLINRVKFWINTDRIGPDIPTSYWKLYFKSTMISLCKSKFKYFADSAEIRPGSYIMGCSKISIGKRVVIRPLSVIQSDAGPGGDEIVIEDDVLLGPGIRICTSNHAYTDISTTIYNQGYDDIRPVVLKKGCWLGADVIVLPGVVIGRNCVIGAGSVVTKSIPDYSVAVGVPAKVIKTLSTAKIKNK